MQHAMTSGTGQAQKYRADIDKIANQNVQPLSLAAQEGQLEIAALNGTQEMTKAVCSICFNFDIEKAIYQTQKIKKVFSYSSCCSTDDLRISARRGCETCKILVEGLSLCNSWEGKLHILLDVGLPLRLEFGSGTQVEFFAKEGISTIDLYVDVSPLIMARRFFALALHWRRSPDLYMSNIRFSKRICAKLARAVYGKSFNVPKFGHQRAPKTGA
jgi:hypothetical protein